MKKAAASKRTALPRTIGYAKSFLKDFERLSRSGRYDMKKLKQVMLLLIANDAPLGPNGKTTHSRANGRVTANAMLVAIFC